MKGFKKCCISSSLDETDVMFLIGSEEVANIRSEGEEDGGSDTDW